MFWIELYIWLFFVSLLFCGVAFLANEGEIVDALKLSAFAGLPILLIIATQILKIIFRLKAKLVLGRSIRYTSDYKKFGLDFENMGIVPLFYLKGIIHKESGRILLRILIRNEK